MLRLARWLVGYVTFCFSGGFTDGFINECYAQHLNITNIRYEGDTLYADCPAMLFRFLRPVAERHGGALSITKRRGLRFVLAPLKNRWGLLAGLVACAALIGFLNGFVWEIEITGTEQLTPQQVSAFLAENGFHEGVYWLATDKDYLENLMLASFDECAWVHINRNGTTATVEIGESVLRPEAQYDELPGNLVATKAGTVTKATVYRGWQAVQAGEGVTPGTLLISGVYESEKAKENLFVHAKGEYLAEVEEPFSLTVSRTQQYKAYLSQTERRYLLFFGLEIPLSVRFEKSCDADISETYDYCRIGGNRVPIGVKTQTRLPYVVREKELTDAELEELLAQEVQNKLDSEFADCEILSKNIETALTAESATAKGSLLCIENIGKEVPLSKEQSNLP